MKKKETLSIIIVTFNSESQIAKCLSQIFLSLVKDTLLKVIIVDNNSSDQTISLIKKKFSKEIELNTLKLICNLQNLGFAKAVNIGINSTKADKYLLLNPDMFVKRGTIEKVLAHSESHGSSIVGVSTVNELGEKTGSYFRFPNLMVAVFDFTNLRKISLNDYWHNHFYYIDENKSISNKITEVDVVTGGFMMIKHSVIEKIGNLDENFFMYLEDVDFCLRANRAGFTVSVCGETLVHIGGASSNNRDKIRHVSWIDSRKKYFFKHHGILVNLLVQPIFLIDDIIILIGRSLRK